MEILYVGLIQMTKYEHDNLVWILLESLRFHTFTYYHSDLKKQTTGNRILTR